METCFDSAGATHAPYGVIVHELPRFVAQAADDSRQELIVSAANTEHGIGSDTSISGNVPSAAANTEHEALARTALLLEDAMTHPRVPEDIVRQAEDMYENLSFVGVAEMTAATSAIAAYWKAYLDDNPESSLFIVTSETFEPDTEEDVDSSDEIDVDLGHVSQNKSDGYVMDKILSHYSDEVLQKYAGRLLFSAADLAKCEPRSTKVIVLDDWVMSGQQMQDRLDMVFKHVAPSDVEINLVVCSYDRLAQGFVHEQATSPIPIKAYFASHDTSHRYAAEFGGAYLTGAHSSGDYPFEGALEHIVRALNDNGETAFMPPLANIVRPYYSPDYRHRYVERLNTLRAIGYNALVTV